MADIIYNDDQYHIIDTHNADDLTITGYAVVDKPLTNTTVDIVNGGNTGSDVTAISLGIVQFSRRQA